MNTETRVVASGTVDRLHWRAYTDRTIMGATAATYVEGLIAATLARQNSVRMIFSAAPSQDELLAGLAASPVIDWSRITAFHMDEYLGIAPDAPQGFGQFLRTRLFAKVPLAAVHYLDVATENAEEECERYGKLLSEAPIDLCCLGVGENGHLAFNDPPVADFSDPRIVKIVPLDPICRRQQVHDGCFHSMEEVPTHAMTLTIPTLMSARHLVCVVPATTKRAAIRRLITDPVISTEVPATAMRRHPSATLFLDRDSYDIG
ncbi:MAG: glucosamine-6-phosphate deaminase [Planctomycetia bacterium]|nr:glucosamine-6-phosphate deaminase [Planctomycetia bacterium]